MWQLLVPVALCAYEGSGLLFVVAGVVAIVLMHQRTKPPTSRVYGLQPYTSARVSEAERVRNKRKVNTDVEKGTKAERTDETQCTTHRTRHLFGRSAESNTRLLSKLHKEMNGDTSE